MKHYNSIGLNLFNKLVPIANRKEFLENQYVLPVYSFERYAIKKTELTEQERKWNEFMDQLSDDPDLQRMTEKATPRDMIEKIMLEFIQDVVEDEFKQLDAAQFMVFELKAQCGEFIFGSNCYGEVDITTGEVTFTSHNAEMFTYESVRDFYDHYVRELPVTYGYSAYIADFDENGNLDVDSSGLNESAINEMKKLNIKQSDDCSEFWSDKVRVTEPCGYSSRRTPIVVNNVLLKA